MEDREILLEALKFIGEHHNGGGSVAAHNPDRSSSCGAR